LKRTSFLAALLAANTAWAGQAPFAASDADTPISHRDRVTPRSSSRTRLGDRSVDNKLLGVIRLGDPNPAI